MITTTFNDLNVTNVIPASVLINLAGSVENGWTPQLETVADGDRIVLRLHDLTGGTGTKPTADIGRYVGDTGYVDDIANARDIRGMRGLQGAAGTTYTFQFATTTLPAGSSPTVSQSISGTTITVTLGLSTGRTGNTGQRGNPGLNGLFPETVAVVEDGARRVLRMTDWAEYDGSNDPSNQYVGSTGLTNLIASAVDIRGPAGTPATMPAVASTTATTLANNQSATATITGDIDALAFAFGLPSGPPPTLVAGTVTTLPAGQNATFQIVNNGGGQYTINLGLPTGPQGQMGLQGTAGSDGTTYTYVFAVTLLAPGSTPTVTQSTSGTTITVTLGLPRGADGTDAVQPSFTASATQLTPGTTPTAAITETSSNVFNIAIGVANGRDGTFTTTVGDNLQEVNTLSVGDNLLALRNDGTLVRYNIQADS